MCFSAQASFGVAGVLLPVGGYCLASAWIKNRRYLLLAAIPVLFGMQQLCEGRVWAGFDLGDPEIVRKSSLMFLFFALVVWPVGVPLAVAAVESNAWKRRSFIALAFGGVLFASAYYLPIAASGGRGLNPTVIGHSIRYDFSAVPASTGWGWLVLYFVSVCFPLIASSNRRLPTLGIAVALAAIGSYVLFDYAFASVWCFFAAVCSAYLAYVLHCLPRRTKQLMVIA